MTRKPQGRGPAAWRPRATVGAYGIAFLLGVFLTLALDSGSRPGVAQSDLEGRIAALEEKLDALSLASNGDWVITGVNVRIRNGSGQTSTINGKGNLIVGYDEANADDEKTGSHNLVVGPYHSYPSYAGLVTGGKQHSQRRVCHRQRWSPEHGLRLWFLCQRGVEQHGQRLCGRSQRWTRQHRGRLLRLH